MSVESVQEINKDLLSCGTREQFRSKILDCLNTFHDLRLEIETLKQRILGLENENRRLKGEKKPVFQPSGSESDLSASRIGSLAPAGSRSPIA